MRQVSFLHSTVIKRIIRDYCEQLYAYKFDSLQETSQINNLTLYLKQLEKEEQTNPKLVEGKKS